MASLTTTLGTVQPAKLNYQSYGVPVVHSTQSQPQAASAFYTALNQGNNQYVAPASDYLAQYDYDPALQKIAAISTQGVEQARNSAADVKRQAFIAAGAPDIATEYGADANTIEAARQNPFSTIALLHRDAADRNRQLTDALNSQNLYYSSEAARQYNNQAFGESQAETDFVAKLRALIAGADQSVLDAEALDLKNNPPQVSTPADVPTALAVHDTPGIDLTALSSPDLTPDQSAEEQARQEVLSQALARGQAMPTLVDPTQNQYDPYQYGDIYGGVLQNLQPAPVDVPPLIQSLLGQPQGAVYDPTQIYYDPYINDYLY